MPKEPRGPYRKSWCHANIYGSSRFDFTQSVRGIWNDLLDLGKLSRVEGGIIAPAPNQCYPHGYLAGLLNTSLEEFENALRVLIETDRISENHNGIKITNWKLYQTDFDRQKPYRDRKKQELTPTEIAERNKQNEASLRARQEHKAKA